MLPSTAISALARARCSGLIRRLPTHPSGFSQAAFRHAFLQGRQRHQLPFRVHASSFHTTHRFLDKGKEGSSNPTEEKEKEKDNDKPSGKESNASPKQEEGAQEQKQQDGSDPSNDQNHQRRQQDQQQQQQQQPPPDDASPFPVVGDIVFVIAVYMIFFAGQTREITFKQFVETFLKTGEVTALRVKDHYAYIVLPEGAEVDGKKVPRRMKYYFKIRPGDTAEGMMVSAFQELGIHPMEVPVVKDDQMDLRPLLFLVVLATILMRRFIRKASLNTQSLGAFGAFRMGTAQPHVVQSPLGGIKFADVAGMKEAKGEVMEFVDYLKSPKRFRELGARIPKGVILTGPPGTGKTLLAKAVSTEAGVPFLAMAGSDFVEMIAGVGASRVRSLFSQAKKSAPCIIFIDEVDAVGRKRADVGGHNPEAEQTLNQLLVEMDGMENLEGVVVMASTNRVDILDKALLRPGRFDRKIEISLPSQPERVEIFGTHLKKLQLEESVSAYAKRLASLTPGHSGADIANICNEAALHAGREKQKVVTKSNFEYAVERVLAGSEKKTVSVAQDERSRSASYESGRCLVAWLLEHSPPPLKTSILPRTTSTLGYTQFAPVPSLLQTKEHIDDQICSLVAGRAAEMVLYDSLSSIGKRHLKQATQLAEKKIQEFGMGDSIGQLSFDKTDVEEKRFYSNNLRHKADREISKSVREASERAVKLLEENKDQLKKLAAALQEKEVLNYKDLQDILGDPPHIKDTFFEM